MSTKPANPEVARASRPGAWARRPGLPTRATLRDLRSFRVIRVFRRPSFFQRIRRLFLAGHAEPEFAPRHLATDHTES